MPADSNTPDAPDGGRSTPAADGGSGGGVGRRGFLGAVGGAAVAGAGVALLGDHLLSNDGSSSGSDDTSSATSESGSSVSNADFSKVSPNEVSLVDIPAGRVDDAVGKLDDLAAGLLKQTGVPGIAIAVVHGDKVVYVKGFGVRNVDSGAKVDADTVFQLASLSKAISSTVVASAVGKKSVSWEDPVVAHLPDFQLADPYVTAHVTLADMYSHRSGLPDHAGDLLEDLDFTQEQILARLREYELEPFRANYAYTNMGLTAAALSAAAANGVSWDQLSQNLLYGPAKMTSTSSSYADYHKAANRADLHTKRTGTWKATYVRDSDAQTPAGGVSSSANDMARWLRLQLAGGTLDGKRIVAEKPLIQTHAPHYTSSPSESLTGRSGFYGLGCGVGYDGAGRLVLAHSGAFAMGAATAFTIIPSADVGIVTLTNGQPIGVPEAVNSTFADLVVAGRSTRDWFAAYEPRLAPLTENASELAGKKPPANPKPAKSDAAYVGTYTSALYGDAVVSAGAKGLELALGPKPQRFTLSHWDGDVFSYEPIGENALGITAVTFTVGASGKASKVNIENLNGVPLIDPELGTFTRA